LPFESQFEFRMEKGKAVALVLRHGNEETVARRVRQPSN